MMKIILLTKPNASGDTADREMRRQLPDAEITTIKLASPDARPVDRDFACDWLISYLCPWVLPASVLEQAARNMNFHPGPPEYPGIGCYNFALYEGAESFGVTCHQMLPKVDSGAIYAVRRFPIPAMATVDVLQDIAHATMMALYLELIESIGKGEPVEAVTDERWTKEATTTRDMERLRCIPLDADSEETERRIRAFAHRDYPGACIELNGRRFYIPYDEI